MNKATIRQLCPDMHSGGTPSTSQPEYWGGDIPWLSSAESGRDYIDYANQFITQLGVDNSAARFAEEGSVIIATAGEGKTRGQVSFLQMGAYINQSLIAMKPDSRTMLPHYLYYYLKNSYSRLRTLSGITGVRGSLSGNLLGSFEVSYPDIQEQHAIVQLLSAIDYSITNNNAICADLEAMMKLFFGYYFTQFDYPDENGMPFRSSGGKMIWSNELRRDIPRSWSVEQLGTICDTRLGGTPDTGVEEYWGGDMPWLSSAEVAVSPILNAERRITKKGQKESATSFAPAGSILLSITRYIRPSILAIDACFNQSVVAVLENETLRAPFLYPFIQSQVPRYMTLRTGAQQPHINKDIVDSTLVLIPPQDVLAGYYDRVEPLFEQLVLSAKQSFELTALRDFLLPMFMNGQVAIGE